MMSKKIYQLFADTIAKINDEEERKATALTVIEVCEKDNPRFDRERFIEWIKRVRAGESSKGLR